MLKTRKDTGCIKEFFEAEKYVENGIKTINFIEIFVPWKL